MAKVILIFTAVSGHAAMPAVQDCPPYSPINLEDWRVEDYPRVEDFSDGEWQRSSNDLIVTQNKNAQPTLFVSNFAVGGLSIRGQMRVVSESDDDFVGFIFGYRRNDTNNAQADYLLLDWKQKRQFYNFGPPSDTPGSWANVGLALSRVKGRPTADEFWGHFTSGSEGVTELARAFTLGSTAWEEATDYDFRFEFNDTGLRVFVNNQLQFHQLGDFSGLAKERFAFYNFSQGKVRYSAFKRRVLCTPVARDGHFATNEDSPVGIILQATDPENDPLNYEILNPPSFGTLSGSGSHRFYTPHPNFHGEDFITFRANDGFTTSNVATVKISVLPVQDLPVARCRNMTVPVNDACSPVVVSVNDGSYDPDQEPVTCVQTPGGPYGTGTHSVRLTCSDPAGAQSSCTATVVVKDLIPPRIVCPGEKELECRDGGAVASYEPTADDNCGVPSIVCLPISGSKLPVGSTEVACMATDMAGNTAACTTQVTVRDTQAPALKVLGGPSLVLACGTPATIDVKASDVCEGDMTSQVEVVGDLPPQPGTYSVRYRVTDAAGNEALSAPRSVTVTGRDELMLIITGSQELNLECKVDEYVDPGAQAWDGCANPLIVSKYNSGDDDGDGIPAPNDPEGEHGPGPNTSAVGTYQIQYIGHYPNWCSPSDPNRCPKVEGIRTVRVRDTMAPVLTLKGPLQMSHQCGGGWTDPGWEAKDTCFGDLSSSVTRTGNVNGWVPGNYTVRYEVRDPLRNSAQVVTRTVNVFGPCVWR